MSTIADIEGRVLDRLEEDRATPQFWSLQREIRPFIVEGMNEAMLISGDPQVRADAVTTLAAGTTLFSLPSDAIAILSLEGPGAISLRKEYLWSLDIMKPTWEQDTGDLPKLWFPYGLTKFGIYPKLTAPVQVRLSYIALPVTAARPYSGAEVSPFAEQFDDGIEEYACHAARLKEGGYDFGESMKNYGRFLDIMRELSRYAVNTDSLRFARTLGAPAKVTDQELK